MNRKQPAIVVLGIAAIAALSVAGCFSYSHTTSPEPSEVVVAPPATTSQTTTTATDNGLVHRQSTTTYSN
jgi:anti-sigma-K factor RskA